MIKQLLLQLVLILCNAFFAATEIALISLNEKKVKARAEEGDEKAVKMLKMIEEPTGFLSTIQIGITLAGFLGSAFAADNFAERLSDWLLAVMPSLAPYGGAINTVSVVLITLILSYFTLVLGELVPKRIAMKNKEKLADVVCGFISVLATILRPIVWLLTASTNGVLRLFGIDPHEKEETVSEEDIVLMLDAGADEGTLDQDNIEYIKNVFKLDRQIAADVMTPRKAVAFLQADATQEEILQFIEEEGYSRIPVYDEDVDHVIGILHTRDFLLQSGKGAFDLRASLHEPVFVPETVNLDLLFKDMQTQHNHIVITVNEYGETSGIVTMEDILEEIVGEIWDERDEVVEDFVRLDDTTYRVLCTASVEDFREFFSIEEDEQSEASTVNGWITEQSGSIPRVGDTITHGNLLITVTAADDFMTHEITVTVTESATVE